MVGNIGFWRKWDEVVKVKAKFEFGKIKKSKFRSLANIT